MDTGHRITNHASETGNGFPIISDFEFKLFRFFARRHVPGYHDNSIQIEGDKQIAVCAAGHRLIKKGILYRNRACHWYLTDLGKRMAETLNLSHGDGATTASGKPK